MRTLIVFALSLTVLLPGFGQSAGSPGPSLPKDPHEVLAAAAAYYDFASPEMKPWHLKASYQFYDLKGNAAEQGTWEYWWVAPKVHRSSFTRAGVEHTTWFTADGAVYSKDSGERLKYFERVMGSMLFSPLPATKAVESGKVKLELKVALAGNSQVACVFTIPQRMQDGQLQVAGSNEESQYCFDPGTLALRMSHANGFTTQYSQFVKMQGHYLAKQVVVTGDKLKLFTVSVETIDLLVASDAEVAPPADATLEKPAQSPHRDGDDGVTAGALIKGTRPNYPAIATMAHEQGTVIVAATIGTDGKISHVEVVTAPSSLLAEAAVEVIKHRQYKPFLLNGAPVEVEILANVMFTMN